MRQSKDPLKNKALRPHNAHKGYTLIELLVALAAASILSASALQLYSRFHHLTLHFIKDYQRESSELIQQMHRAIPYSKSRGETIKRKNPRP